MKKLIFIITILISISIKCLAQFPAPTNFHFSYYYILLGEWGVCCGQSVNGPGYCSYFNWSVPDTASTEATLEYYKIYFNNNLYNTVDTEIYEVNEGFK